MSRGGPVYFRVSITRFNDAPRIIPRISENELKLYLSRATPVWQRYNVFVAANSL